MHKSAQVWLLDATSQRKHFSERMMNLLALVLCWFLVVDPGPTVALSTPWKLARGNRNRRRADIVIHRIKDPWLEISHCIDGLEMNIDDPELYYDHCDDPHNHPNSMYYLATWKNESPIIGMVEVGLDVVEEEDDFEKLPVPILRGLCFDAVRTARPYQRKGVGSKLFQAIERDATELMKNMTLAYHENNSEVSVLLPTHGMLEIRAWSVTKRKSLAFFLFDGVSVRAMGRARQSAFVLLAAFAGRYHSER